MKADFSGLRTEDIERKPISAWIVSWTFPEDRVVKKTGTIACILPRRFSGKQMVNIVNGIYLAYCYHPDGQYYFAMTRFRRNPLARIMSEEWVNIGEMPGLDAHYSRDVRVIWERGDRDIQTVCWTEPDYYQHGPDGVIAAKVPGQKRKHTFDYRNYRSVTPPV